MPTTPVLALPYPAPTAPADVPADIHALDLRIEAVRGAADGLASLDSGGHVPATQLGSVNIARIALASFPPAAPADGDQYWLTLPSSYDPVSGKAVRWLVCYNSAAAVWDVSGRPLAATVATRETPASTGSYIDLTTVGPSLTVPRPGLYLIGLAWLGDGGDLGNGSSSAAMGVSIAGAGASDAEALLLTIKAASPTPQASGERRFAKTLAAGNTLVAKYKAGATSNGFQARMMTLYPLNIT